MEMNDALDKYMRKARVDWMRISSEKSWSRQKEVLNFQERAGRSQE